MWIGIGIFVAIMVFWVYLYALYTWFFTVALVVCAVAGLWNAYGLQQAPPTEVIWWIVGLAALIGWLIDLRRGRRRQAALFEAEARRQAAMVRRVAQLNQ